MLYVTKQFKTTAFKCKCNNLRKFARFKKIEQIEEFFQIVLKRSSSQQQLVLDFVLAQRAEKLTTETPQITNHHRHTGQFFLGGG